MMPVLYNNIFVITVKNIKYYFPDFTKDNNPSYD